MCTVTINSVIGTPISISPPLTKVTVSGISNVCEFVKITVRCGGSVQHQIVNSQTGNWQFDFNVKCPCGENIIVLAECVDQNGSPQPNCQSDTYSGTIQCEGDECCLNFVDNIQIGECVGGSTPVTFNISFNITNSTCLPYVLYIDWGDGTGNSTPQVFNSVGPHTFTDTHTYNSPSPVSYTAVLNYTLNTGCSSKNIPVNLQGCGNEDCCPDVSAGVNVKNCNNDCKREVEVITTFTPPTPDCPYASMQWEYYDSNSIFIQYGQSFNNLMTSPHTDTVFLSSTQSPVTAILKIANPPLDCPDIVKTITIPDCGGCPNISSFTHSVKDCVKRAEKCCRKIEFEIKGTFCGNPKIRIEYGDGNYDEQIVQNNGSQTIIFDNEYCSDGNFNVVLKTLNPSGCQDEILNINVPKCEPKDCGTVDPDPDPVKPKPFCPCCILLLLLILSYFIGWALGWYQGGFNILGVQIGYFGIASLLYGLLTWLIINFCYKRHKDCKKCWECRVFKCAFYSLVIAAIIILILFIISLFTPLVVPLWWQSMTSAIGAALIFLALMSSQRCKNFFDTGDCN